MIILPDRNIARQTKYLKPIPRHQWYGPHPYGPDVKLEFNTWIAQAFRSDHSMVWHGHFEDRDDADAFMWALYSGTLKTDPYLKRLPRYCYSFDQRQIPIWAPGGFDPDMLDDHSIMYNMVSNIGIGPSSGTWGAPGDCYGLASRAGEFIDCIAAGGGGGAGSPGYILTGGGGGGFARLANGPAMTPGQQFSYEVGNGGAGGGSVNNIVAGAGGTAHTWFYSPANPGVRATVGGGGYGGGAYNTVNAGGAGGGADAGNYGMAGGRGGNTIPGPPAYGSVCTGGGAAANPSGAGANGQDLGGPAGGNGAGGVSAGLIYGPWGPGSGGAGAHGGNGIVGGHGAHYGGGGGSAQNNVTSVYAQYGGNGGGGLIVIRYEPQYAPTVSSITPNSGPTGGGQAVRINGSFVSVTSANIGGAPITGMTYNSTDVYGTTSAGGAGTYNVNVYRNNGPSPGVGGSLYTYVTPPSVSSCAPSSGPTIPNNAVLVVITGANLTGVNSVTFGGVAASPIAVINSTTVHAWAPAHAAGLVNVVVTNSYGTGTGTNVFTYVTPPSLSAVASPVPALGLTHGGTAVTLTGANLTGVTSVTFGGAAATSVVVVNATTITCITPAHARGLVDIVATNTYGSATLANGFTYLLPAAGFNMPMMGV